METLAVLVVVAAAAGYLLRRAVSVFQSRKTGCCSGCDGCPAATETDAEERFHKRSSF